MKNKLIAVAILGTFVFAGSAYAQSGGNTNDATTNGTNTNTSGSAASNLGNSLTNNFNSPADTNANVNENESGTITEKGNTAVGLGSFAGSFSQDYCGGTAQFGFSVPGFTGAGGVPVEGPVGLACVKLRSVERTMQISASFGIAAHTASLSGDKVAAEAYARTSQTLATAAINIVCSVDSDVRQAYLDAGIACPPTEAEKKQQQQAAQNQAQVQTTPQLSDDPLIRARQLASAK